MLIALQLRPTKIVFRVGNFNNNCGFAFISSSTSPGIELRNFQMSEAASSVQIHLGIGPRDLCNVWTKTTQKGFLNEK
jgi:hypothetical protein